MAVYKIMPSAKLPLIPAPIPPIRNAGPVLLEKEINLSELSEAELSQLYAMDEYPSDSTYFDVLEYRVAVKDDRLAEALAALPSKKRDVILLSYFLDMTDTEIAEKLKVVGSTIHRRRTSSLEELKLRLEVKEDGQSAE